MNQVYDLHSRVYESQDLTIMENAVMASYAPSLTFSSSHLRHAMRSSGLHSTSTFKVVSNLGAPFQLASLAINTHSKLESYIREHSRYY